MTDTAKVIASMLVIFWFASFFIISSKFANPQRVYLLWMHLTGLPWTIERVFAVGELSLGSYTPLAYLGLAGFYSSVLLMLTGLVLGLSNEKYLQHLPIYATVLLGMWLFFTQLAAGLAGIICAIVGLGIVWAIRLASKREVAKASQG